MDEQSLFLAALDIPDPGERGAYLDRACSGNPALRGRIDALLAAHARSGEFLDIPALKQMAYDPATPTVGHDGESAKLPPDLSFLQPSTTPGSLGRLQHYEIREVVGRGGCGVVLKAFDSKLERIVAIKVIAPEFSVTSPARKRFLREARATAAIRHENVVNIYAVEEHPLPFLVMEYIDGVSLQQQIDRTGPLDPRDVLRIGRQLADGLAAAHAKGLIHRDVKPANVLLEDGGFRAKLTDFGLARTADDASLTQSGAVAGTPLYMSPEQAQGRTLDARSDLFSLGSVLYVMACGRPPFRAPTALAVMKRVVEEEPRPVPTIIPEVPDELAALIARLHRKNPDERYGLAREVADRLGELAPEFQLGSRRPVRTSRPAWRRWTVRIVVTLGLAGVGAVGVDSMRGTTGVPPPSVKPPMALGAVTNPDLTAIPVASTVTDPDREAAKRSLLYLRRWAEVTVNGEKRIIRNASQIPSEPFTFTTADLKDTKVDDASMAFFARCKQLRNLDLHNAPIDNHVLRHFDGCDSLETLNLSYSKATGAALAHFRQCRGIKKIHLCNIGVTDADLQPLDLPMLEELDMGGAQVTDKCAAIIARWTNLKSLGLAYTGVTDNALKHLKALPILEKLVVNNTGVTDAGLESLHPCQDLRHLNVGATKVTAAGIERLRNNLPKCQITWDGGTVAPSFSPAAPTYRDYDEIATGAWTPLPKDEEEFRRILADKTFAKRYGLRDSSGIGFKDGVLKVRAGGAFLAPVSNAGDVIIRAKVWKPAGANRVMLRLRQTNSTNYFGAGYGNDDIIMGRSRPEWVNTMNKPIRRPDGFIEIAIAAVGNSLHTFVDGRRILAIEEDPVPEGYASAVIGMDALDCEGQFKDIEYQRLDARAIDRPLPSPRTPAERTAAEHRAAEAVFKLGGWMYVRSNGKIIRVDNVAKLPADPFTVIHFDISDREDVAGYDPLKALRNCTELESFSIQNSNFWSPDLTWASGLTGIKRANLTHAGVRGTSLKYLTTNKGLQQLLVWGVGVRDVDLLPLRDHVDLVYVDLGANPLTDAATDTVARWKSLAHLRMAFTGLTDKGLVALSSLPKLQHLSIYNNSAITDVGLASLHQSKNLRNLEVRATKVTAAGVALLHEKLPLCVIDWDNGTIKPVPKWPGTTPDGK